MRRILAIRGPRLASEGCPTRASDETVDYTITGPCLRRAEGAAAPSRTLQTTSIGRVREGLHAARGTTAQKKAPGRGGVPGGKDCSHSGSDWRSLRIGTPLRRTPSAERLTVSAHSAAKPGLHAGFPARARGTTTPKCKPHRRVTSAADGDLFPRPGCFHKTRRQDTDHPAKRSRAFFSRDSSGGRANAATAFAAASVSEAIPASHIDCERGRRRPGRLAPTRPDRQAASRSCLSVFERYTHSRMREFPFFCAGLHIVRHRRLDAFFLTRRQAIRGLGSGAFFS